MKNNIKSATSKVLPLVVLGILIVVLGYTISYRFTELSFALTNPEQVNIAKKLYEAEHKEADQRYASRFISPVPDK